MYKILDKNSLKEKYGDPKNSGSPFDLGFPLFEISDKEIEEIYYFRWNVFSRHIKKTSHGYVVTEFLPDVPWAGIHNTISCAAAHHFYEGISNAVKVPVVNIIEQTALFCKFCGVQRIGLLATQGTAASGAYEKHLERYGIKVLTLSEEEQSTVSAVIFDQIKAGSSGKVFEDS